MRVTLLFMVLGGIFTIGAAYIHDTNHPLGSPRRLVNWDVAAEKVGLLKTYVREQAAAGPGATTGGR
jgi:hypothetical protein